MPDGAIHKRLAGPAGFLWRCVGRVSGSKSLQRRVREIQKLIEDADETLAQARWALETLVFRLAQEDGEAGAGSGT